MSNPSRNDTECQEDSQGNSLAAGVEQVSDDVELTTESIDETDDPTGGVVLDQRSKSKGKRKAANRPDSSAKKAKKWAWTPEAVEILLKYIKEYKTKCEFNGVDFEADLSGMYTEVRRCLAMASGFRGFAGRDSPGDNPTHVNGGYLLTLLEG